MDLSSVEAYTFHHSVKSYMTHPGPTQKKPMVIRQERVDTNPPTALRQAPDTSTWLSRHEATDLIGCSHSTLLNYERRGVLHPQVALRPDPQGIERRTMVYHPDDLKKIKGRVRRAVREPNEFSAMAFDLFRAGMSLEAVVSELRTAPEEIERLHEKWLDLGGARLVISGTAKEALAEIVGPFESVTELVERVVKLKTSAA